MTGPALPPPFRLSSDVSSCLLARIADLTAGRSLEANVALIRNNAGLAAAIAVALAS